MRSQLVGVSGVLFRCLVASAAVNPHPSLQSQVKCAAEAAGQPDLPSYRHTMSRWHNYYMDGMVHFCTATVNEWQPLLDDGAAAVLYRQWKQAGELFGVRVLAYVVMPNHIHLLLWSESGESVRRFMQWVLSHSSKIIGKGGKFWKERLRVVCVCSPDKLRIKLDYIHANPVRRGLAQAPVEWKHSSFRQLETGDCDSAYMCDPWPEGLGAS